MADLENIGNSREESSEARRLLRSMLAKAMESVLENSEFNIPQPFPLVDSKAVKKLSTDDYISWQTLQKEWAKISPEGKKTISVLLVLNSHTMVEALNVGNTILKETQDTVEYARAHPEYQREKTEDSGFNSFWNTLKEEL